MQRLASWSELLELIPNFGDLIFEPTLCSKIDRLVYKFLEFGW